MGLPKSAPDPHAERRAAAVNRGAEAQLVPGEPYNGLGREMVL